MSAESGLPFTQHPETSAEPGQALLKAFLAAESGDEREELLRRLIVEVARPLATRVIRRRFFTSRNTADEDQEDVAGDAIAGVLARVRGLTGTDDPAIRDFESFVAGVASRSASRFFMARTPQRTLLRGRLRYVMTTDSRFRIWRSGHDTWLCGLAGKTELAGILSDADVEALRGRLAATSLPARLPELAHKVLTSARGAMELSALTSLAADSLGISDRNEPVEDVLETLVANGASPADRAEVRQRVEMIWSEVCQIPLPQRRALLLNLGSAGSGGQSAGAWLIPDLGIATFRQVAEQLGLSAEELAELWNRLPLPDNDIAARFGLERQQVINLRSAARQRLLRRFGKDGSPI